MRECYSETVSNYKGAVGVFLCVLVYDYKSGGVALLEGTRANICHSKWNKQ